MDLDPSAAVLDRPRFDDFASLFDAGELRDVIAEWHAEGTTALAAIDEALDRGDLAAIGQLAHRAAGGALAFGAMALAAVCEAVRAAAESDAGVTGAGVDAMRAAIDAAHRAMIDAAGL